MEQEQRCDEKDHCTHWQEGDGSCCKCGEPNWCPDGGVDEAEHVPEGAL